MATQTVENVTARNIAIARAAYQAYVTKDRGALENLIAEDFHFTSSLDNRLDRETYFRRCWPNSKNIEGFEFIQLVPHADRVFVTYEGRNIDGRRFRNTEILTMRPAPRRGRGVLRLVSAAQGGAGGFVSAAEQQ